MYASTHARDSSVGTVTRLQAGRVKNRCSIPGRGERLSCIPTCPQQRNVGVSFSLIITDYQGQNAHGWIWHLTSIQCWGYDWVEPYLSPTWICDKHRDTFTLLWMPKFNYMMLGVIITVLLLITKRVIVLKKWSVTAEIDWLWHHSSMFITPLRCQWKCYSVMEIKSTKGIILKIKYATYVGVKV